MIPRYGVMTKTLGKPWRRHVIPLKCKICNRDVKPSGRREQFEICNRCRRKK